MSTTKDLLQSLCELNRIKKSLASQAKDIEKQITIVERQLMDAMDADGVTEAGNTQIGKVSLSESVYPQVEAWDVFGDYILTNRYLHLLERRPAVLAYRELLSLGRAVPGVLPFTKRKITFKES